MFPKILPIITQHVSPRDTLILGVSGGPDSTALLDILVRFYKNRACGPLIVAHINHGIRGAEADRDEKFVRSLAKSYGLRFEVKRVKLIGKSGLEERGRKIRRDFFEKLREKYKAKWIMTAHTQGDQLETIIFNFLRGSGPAGLAGMKMTDGHYFKPLLGVSKAEILAYLKSKKLKFCRDRTNEDTRFRRNFIRKKILPLFSKINPSFHRTILQNSKIFENIEQWLEDSANQFLNQQKSAQGLFWGKPRFPPRARSASSCGTSADTRPPSFGSTRSGPTKPKLVLRKPQAFKPGDEALFQRNHFLNLPKALQRSVIQQAYRGRERTHYGLPFIKVEEVRRMVEKGIGRKRIECQGGVFSLEKGVLKFRS